MWINNIDVKEDLVFCSCWRYGTNTDNINCKWLQKELSHFTHSTTTEKRKRYPYLQQYL